MTRALLCAALSALALPAFAQSRDSDEDRRVEIVIDEDVIADEDIEILRDGPREMRFEIRRGGGEGDSVRVFRFGGPEGAAWMGRLGEGLGRLGGRLPEMFEMEGDGPFGMIEAFGMGGSPETREAMRRLQREARDLARQAREADGAERARLDTDLDRVLGELFEVRGQARRERAEHLRERAQALMAEADEVEASLAEREAERARLIDERKRDLLGEPGADW